MDDKLIPYLAGAIDSDGWISFHRAGKYHTSPSERLELKQVTPNIPFLLKECFGGIVIDEKPCAANGRMLFHFSCTHLKATEACERLLPYLRIKRPQAEILIKYKETRDLKYRSFGFWFEKEFPNWRSMELITSEKVANMLGCDKNWPSLGIRNGKLLAVPLPKTGLRTIHYKRFPKLLIERIANLNGTRKYAKLPLELLKWKYELANKVWDLNKVGYVPKELKELERLNWVNYYE